MIGTTRSLRVFAYAAPVDLRKGYDGLYGLVVGDLERDPLTGDCFLFVNRNRTRAKVLVWDVRGFASSRSGSSAAGLHACGRA